MENIADDVLHNILARIPRKPLLRFRCVSKNWNDHIISYRCLIKSTPRQMILLPFTRPLVAIDANEPHHMVKLPHSPLDDEEEHWTQLQVSFVGTLDGIVLLALTHEISFYVDNDNAGMYVNGVLYWVTLRPSNNFGIFALNVRKMVFSDIKPPGLDTRIGDLVLGSIGGCLCVANKVSRTRFDVWVMKEECSWMKTHSFNFHLERRNCFQAFYPICILGNGKILIMKRCSSSTQLVIYDTSTDSYKTVCALPYDDVKMEYMTNGFRDIRSIEYTESLVSPSNMCLSSIRTF